MRPGHPPSSHRPRRSALYMPASNARALARARSLEADILIFDLEDAVAPEAKGVARSTLEAALGERGYGTRELVVRVNGLDTPWGEDDLALAARLPVDAVLLPKVEDPDDVSRAAARLRGSGGAGTGDHLDIWIMAETPQGILGLQSIVRASPTPACIVLGTSDLGTDLRLPPDPERLGLLAPLSHAVLVARARGIGVLDGVHLDLRDASGFAAACRQGRRLGFDGKTLIHPSQIETANRVFGPSEEAVGHARRVMAAWEEARGQGRGIAVLDGRLVENLHVREAERVLAMAAVLEGRSARGGADGAGEDLGVDTRG